MYIKTTGTYLLTYLLGVYREAVSPGNGSVKYIIYDTATGEERMSQEQVLPCSAGKPRGLEGGRQVPVACRPIGIAKNESTRPSLTDKLSWCRLVARIDGSPEGRPRAELTTHRGNILILCPLFSVTVYTVPRVSVSVTDASRE